jgi:hypothetical protein
MKLLPDNTFTFATGPYDRAMKRKQITKIAGHLALIMMALYLLTRKIAEQMVLPGRHRKGNIFSMVLFAFVSLSDIVTTCSKGLLPGFAVRWKYHDQAVRIIRKSVLLTGCLLFLLSSVEWSYQRQPRLKEAGFAIQDARRAGGAASSAKRVSYGLPLINVRSRSSEVASVCCRFKAGDSPSITLRVYLHNCHFRI